MNIKEKWREGTMMYRAGIHPNQDKITLALAKYLSEKPKTKEKL